LNKHLLKLGGWNLIGQLIPMISAIIVIPFFINMLGVEIFGVLTIFWMVVGYFSLFDFGLSRSLAKLVSKSLALNELDKIKTTVFTGLTLLLLLGCLAGFLVHISTDAIINLIGVSDETGAVVQKSFFFLSFAVPLVIVTTGIRGVLEGFSAFKVLSLIRMPIGSLMFLAPAIVLYITQGGLVEVTVTLLSIRGLGFLMHIILMKNYISNWFDIELFNTSQLSELFKFGGWVTVSSIVSPLLGQVDRFLISGVLGIAVVAFYSTPYEMATKLLVVSSALSGVLFPHVSKLVALGEIGEIKSLYLKATWIIALLLTPIGLFLSVFSYDVISIWISKDFADSSWKVMSILSLGVVINGISNIPYSFIQGAGKPNVTALFHLVELALYIPLLYICILYYGLVGAACAWTFRVILDALMLHSYSVHLFKKMEL